MTIETPTKIQVSANTRNTDKEDQIIIDTLKLHIELLEEKKRGIEEIIIDKGITTLFVNGTLMGLNLAIKQLYDHINQLKER